MSHVSLKVGGAMPPLPKLRGGNCPPCPPGSTAYDNPANPHPKISIVISKQLEML